MDVLHLGRPVQAGLALLGTIPFADPVRHSGTSRTHIM